MDIRISILQDNKNSRDWLHHNVNVLYTTELYMQKWSRWEIYVMCTLP